MKNSLLAIGCLLTTTLSAQQTITSVQNGNASSPFTWDCFCFPTSDDSIVINHQVKMDVDWLVNSGGAITVNGGASLIQNGTHSILFDQGGSQLLVKPNGWSEMQNMSFTNAAVMQNDGTVLIHDAMLVGSSCQATNNGSFGMVDSILVQGVLSNNGVFGAGNVLISGQSFNTGTMDVDSLGVTGQLTSYDGNFWLTAFGNNGTTIFNDTYIITEGNFYNAENLTTNTATEIICNGSFYTGDTLGGSAFANLNGSISIAQDFGVSDGVDGSAKICIGGVSTNVGTINGTLNLCDNGASGLDFNFGTIANSVVFCSPVCYVNIEEISNDWSIFPNPSETSFQIEGIEEGTRLELWSAAGVLVKSLEFNGESIDVSSVSSGAYVLKVLSTKGISVKSVLIQ